MKTNTLKSSTAIIAILLAFASCGNNSIKQSVMTPMNNDDIAFFTKRDTLFERMYKMVSIIRETTTDSFKAEYSDITYEDCLHFTHDAFNERLKLSSDKAATEAYPTEHPEWIELRAQADSLVDHYKDVVLNFNLDEYVTVSVTGKGRNIYTDIEVPRVKVIFKKGSSHGAVDLLLYFSKSPFKTHIQPTRIYVNYRKADELCTQISKETLDFIQAHPDYTVEAKINKVEYLGHMMRRYSPFDSVVPKVIMTTVFKNGICQDVWAEELTEKEWTDIIHTLLDKNYESIDDFKNDYFYNELKKKHGRVMEMLSVLDE